VGREGPPRSGTRRPAAAALARPPAASRGGPVPRGAGGALILYATLGVCALGAAVIVYGYDLYDREPLAFLALAVVAGALGMSGVGRLEAAVFRRFGIDRLESLALAGASLEEAMKLAVVALFAVTARRTFNDPMDGLVYGSMAGLGAALDEGTAVLRLLPAGYLLPPPELVRLCGHLVMGGIGGFGVGCVYLRGRKGTRVLVLSFLAAVLLHFGWDFLALRADRGFGLDPRERLLGAALMLAGLLLYGRLVAVGERWSHDLFAPDQPLPGEQWPWGRRG